MKFYLTYFLKLNLLLLFFSALFGCGEMRIVDLDEEIENYLEASSLLHDVLTENNLSGYEYSSFRKEGLSIQAFLMKNNSTSYIITDLYRKGDAEYRLRAIRYIEGKIGTPDYKQDVLYIENHSQ